MEGNRMKDEGTTKLMEMMYINNSLQVLSISNIEIHWNILFDEGAYRIASGLVINKCLRELC